MSDDDWFSLLLKYVCALLMFVVVMTVGLVLGALVYLVWSGRG